MNIETARERQLDEAYKAFNLEDAEHPERFASLEPKSEGLEQSDGSEWLTDDARAV